MKKISKVKKRIKSKEVDQFAPWLSEPHTTVRASAGIVEQDKNAEQKITVIDPPSPYPLRTGLRFNLTEEHLGKLECLARSRFEIGTLKKNMDLTTWDPSKEEFRAEIAQSVNASSAIEDEGIAAEHLDLLLTAATNNEGSYANDELQRRKDAIKSICKAQYWALSNPYKEWISPNFILELHHQMFESTRGRIAGKLKTETVQIRGGGYDIETLHPDKTEEFLKALCERTSRKLDLAQKHAETSMFLTCAEFIVDFLAIHPFKDGNGRTARLLSTYLLERSGYHFARFYDLDSIILERRNEYYSALFNSQKRWYQPDEDLTPWINFYISAVFNQWERAYRRVREESLRKKGKGK